MSGNDSTAAEMASSNPSSGGGSESGKSAPAASSKLSAGAKEWVPTFTPPSSGGNRSAVGGAGAAPFVPQQRIPQPQMVPTPYPPMQGMAMGVGYDQYQYGYPYQYPMAQMQVPMQIPIQQQQQHQPRYQGNGSNKGGRNFNQQQPQSHQYSKQKQSQPVAIAGSNAAATIPTLAEDGASSTAPSIADASDRVEPDDQDVVETKEFSGAEIEGSSVEIGKSDKKLNESESKEKGISVPPAATNATPVMVSSEVKPISTESSNSPSESAKIPISASKAVKVDVSEISETVKTLPVKEDVPVIAKPVSEIKETSVTVSAQINSSSPVAVVQNILEPVPAAATEPEPKVVEHEQPVAAAAAAPENNLVESVEKLAIDAGAGGRSPTIRVEVDDMATQSGPPSNSSVASYATDVTEDSAYSASSEARDTPSPFDAGGDKLRSMKPGAQEARGQGQGQFPSRQQLGGKGDSGRDFGRGGFEGGRTMSGKDGWTRQEAPAAGGAAGRGSDRDRGDRRGPPDSPDRSGGGGGGWKRGEGVESVDEMLSRSDGVQRFSKQTLLDVFFLDVVSTITPPEEIKALYPRPYVYLRNPYTPKGYVKPNAMDRPHEDEVKIFGHKEKDKEEKAVDPTKAILQKAQLILNKLSVEKFDKLSDEFMSVGLDTPDLMAKAVDMIVSKAQMEEHFCFMYADLCRKMTDKWSVAELSSVSMDSREDGGLLQSRDDGDDTTDLGKAFRNRLLGRCQEEFQRDRIAELEQLKQADLTPEEREEKIIILKKQFTGHMRFIGEIYMKDLVKAKIMERCIEELMSSDEDENLVCLTKLLTTIGARLEDYCAKKRKHFVNNCFAHIDTVSTSHPNSRVRFMLRDLIDMRRTNWEARRKVEKAKKLSEIRGEDTNTPKGGAPGSGKSTPANTPKSQDARRLAGSHPPTPQAAPVDDWQTVPSSKSKKGADSSKAAASVPTPTSSKSGSGQVGGAFSALSSSKSSSSKKNPTGRDTPKSGSSSTKDGKTPKAGPSSGKSSGSGKPPAGAEKASKSGKGPKAFTFDETHVAGQEADSGAASGQANANAPEAPGADGTIDKELLKKTRVSLEEYIVNGVNEEAVQDMRSIVHPNAMGEVVKGLLLVVMEKKLIDRQKYSAFLNALFDASFLTSAEALRGIMLVLHDLDDLAIDVPLVSTYTAFFVGALAAHKAVDLSFLAQIPEENNFSLSTNIPGFVGEVLKEVAEISAKDADEAAGLAFAKELLLGSGIDMKSLIDMGRGPRESFEDALTEFVTKYNLPFLRQLLGSA